MTYSEPGAKLIAKTKSKLLKQAWEWCEKASLKRITHSSYAPKRKELWLSIGSNLQSIQAGRDKLFVADSPPQWMQRIGDKILPGWHSILVCGANTTIRTHKDHSHFTNWAAMLNLGKARYYWEQNEKAHSILLEDGDVVLIQTKYWHSAKQLSKIRYNITFRHIKPEHLNRFKLT
ncbi:MAG: hypothetical protein AB4426_19725 [Xenococcaceae cyanobacterium]